MIKIENTPGKIIINDSIVVPFINRLTPQSLAEYLYPILHQKHPYLQFIGRYDGRGRKGTLRPVLQSTYKQYGDILGCSLKEAAKMLKACMFKAYIHGKESVLYRWLIIITLVISTPRR